MKEIQEIVQTRESFKTGIEKYSTLNLKTQ